MILQKMYQGSTGKGLNVTIIENKLKVIFYNVLTIFDKLIFIKGSTQDQSDL